MLQIAYTSTASFEFKDGDLITVLMTSRVNNRRLGLTGILLYSDRHFVQVIEGPNDAVNSKYEAIAADPRHEQVALLHREEIEARQFPKWTMGYKSLSDPLVALIPGYDKFFSSQAANAETPMRHLLERFRQDPSLSQNVSSE